MRALWRIAVLTVLGALVGWDLIGSVFGPVTFTRFHVILGVCLGTFAGHLLWPKTVVVYLDRWKQ